MYHGMRLFKSAFDLLFQDETANILQRVPSGRVVYEVLRYTHQYASQLSS